MLMRGTGVPAAPDKMYEPADATHALFMSVKAVVSKLKKSTDARCISCPACTADRIDQQEGRGYLLGAVLGRGLLSRVEAQTSGLDARNKITALEKRLTTQKEAVRRAAGIARKADGDAIAKQTPTAKAELEAIEHERAKLDLPCPPFQPSLGQRLGASVLSFRRLTRVPLTSMPGASRR